MACSTGISLLTVERLTLLDGLDDWWDWDAGSAISAKGVTQQSTGTGDTTIPTTGGKPSGYISSSVGVITNAHQHVRLHDVTGGTYDQQVNNLPYVVTVCGWFSTTSASCLRMGSDNAAYDYYSDVSNCHGIHFGNMQAFSRDSTTLKTVSIPNTFSKTTGFTFVVFEWLMNTPSDILNIYSDVSGSLALVNTLTVTSLAVNIGGRLFLDCGKPTYPSTSGAIACDGLASYNRQLSFAEMGKLYNNGNGVTYSQLPTL